MIMSTFIDSYDFTGKTVHPFVTYAVSGLGSIERDYATSCPGARIGAGAYEANRFPSIGSTWRPGCVRPGSPHDPSARASDPTNTTHSEM